MTPRIGIVGGGTFGTMHLRAATQAHRRGEIELVGLADTDPAVRDRQARAFGVRTFETHTDLIGAGNLHGIAVVTPDHLHRAVVLDCLAAGLHVLCEKPLATTVDDALAMHTAATDAGLLLQVDFHKRYDPYHRQLRRSIRAGDLGAMQYGYAFVENQIVVPTEMLRAWSHDSSSMWFLGVHKIDLMLWMMGGRAVRVYGSGKREVLRGMGIDTWDSLSARIELDTGAYVTIDTSWILPTTFESIINQAVRVIGDHGLCEIDGQDRGHRAFTRDAGETLNLGFYEELPPSPFQGEGRGEGGSSGAPRPPQDVTYVGYGIESIVHFYRNLAFLLDGGSLSDLTGAYPDSAAGLHVTQIAAAAHESAKTGRPVDLDDLGLSAF